MHKYVCVCVCACVCVCVCVCGWIDKPRGKFIDWCVYVHIPTKTLIFP